MTKTGDDRAPRVSFTLVAADTVAPAALHAAFRRAFADYLIGPFEVPLDQWPMFLARQGVDLARSRVALDARGQPLAFALTAPRPALSRWRLGTMGATPEARGGGAARALLDDFIHRAAQDGQAAVELEVFAQNERARRLYEGRGFAPAQALYGFTAELAALPLDGPGEAPRAVDREAMLDWLTQAERRIAELPLQVGPVSVGLIAEPLAWRLGDAQLVFSLPDDTVMVHSLIAPAPDEARALLCALAAVYGQRKLRVPQLQRDDLGGSALRALGATPQPLHQLLMVRSL